MLFRSEEHCVLIGSNWYLKEDDDVRWSRHDDEYYLADECEWSEQLQSYMHESDVTLCEDGEYYYHEDVVKTHDGKYVHEDEAVVGDDGKYYMIGECSEIEDNESVTN